MLGRKRAAPRRIVELRGHLSVLLGMDTNPMVGQVERAVYLFRKMTRDAAADPVHRAQARMIRHGGAMATQTRFFAPSYQHGVRRVLMRVVTVGAGDLTGALTPAFTV